MYTHFVSGSVSTPDPKGSPVMIITNILIPLCYEYFSSLHVLYWPNLIFATIFKLEVYLLSLVTMKSLLNNIVNYNYKPLTKSGVWRIDVMPDSYKHVFKHVPATGMPCAFALITAGLPEQVYWGIDHTKIDPAQTWPQENGQTLLTWVLTRLDMVTFDWSLHLNDTFEDKCKVEYYVGVARELIDRGHGLDDPNVWEVMTSIQDYGHLELTRRLLVPALARMRRESDDYFHRLIRIVNPAVIHTMLTQSLGQDSRDARNDTILFDTLVYCNDVMLKDPPHILNDLIARDPRIIARFVNEMPTWEYLERTIKFCLAHGADPHIIGQITHMPSIHLLMNAPQFDVCHVSAQTGQTILHEAVLVGGLALLETAMLKCQAAHVLDTILTVVDSTAHDFVDYIHLVYTRNNSPRLTQSQVVGWARWFVKLSKLNIVGAWRFAILISRWARLWNATSAQDCFYLSVLVKTAYEIEPTWWCFDNLHEILPHLTSSNARLVVALIRPYITINLDTYLDQITHVTKSDPAPTMECFNFVTLDTLPFEKVEMNSNIVFVMDAQRAFYLERSELIDMVMEHSQWRLVWNGDFGKYMMRFGYSDVGVEQLLQACQSRLSLYYMDKSETHPDTYTLAAAF